MSTDEATTMHLRATTDAAPVLEDCYRNLVAAIILQAARDLREPGYRRKAAHWLRTETARAYAELVDIEPDAVQALVRR